MDSFCKEKDDGLMKLSFASMFWHWFGARFFGGGYFAIRSASKLDSYPTKLQIEPAGMLLIFCLSAIGLAQAHPTATTDDGKPYILTAEQAAAPAHHVRHAELFSRDVNGINLLVMKAIDKVQATAMDGGGYFTGVHAQPAESPIGYELKLFGHSLLAPPRTTSYCSGASYTAFIETLNLLYPDAAGKLSTDRVEALRMQEPDGSRRDDWVKFWGYWNADGPGSQFALVQYSGMGKEISPKQARPGDFVNINWNNGLGHSVVFLGWVVDAEGKKSIRYWSSQTGTHGLGDQTSALAKVKSVVVIRLTKPEKVFTLNPEAKVKRDVEGEKADW
jgi:hypothetical protein